MEPGVAVSLAAILAGAIGYILGSEVERRRRGLQFPVAPYPQWTYKTEKKTEMVDPGAAAVPFPATTEKIVTDAYAGQKIVGAREDEDWEDDPIKYPPF